MRPKRLRDRREVRIARPVDKEWFIALSLVLDVAFNLLDGFVLEGFLPRRSQFNRIARNGFSYFILLADIARDIQIDSSHILPS